VRAGCLRLNPGPWLYRFFSTHGGVEEGAGKNSGKNGADWPGQVAPKRTKAEVDRATWVMSISAAEPRWSARHWVCERFGCGVVFSSLGETAAELYQVPVRQAWGQAWDAERAGQRERGIEREETGAPCSGWGSFSRI